MTRSVDEALELMLRDQYGESLDPISDDDPEFDRVLEEILAERGQSGPRAQEQTAQADERPATTRKRPPRRSLRRAVAWGSAIAATVAAFWVGSRSSLPAVPSGDLSPVLGGALADFRGEARSAEVLRYGPSSEISVRFVQNLNPGDVPAAAAGAFLLDANGKLRLLEMRVTRVEAGARVTLTIEGGAGALFADGLGRKSLVFGVAGASAEDVRRASGMSFEEARALRGVIWRTAEIELVRPSAAIDAALYHYARILGAPGRARFVFTRDLLPRLRVRADASDPYQLRLSIDGAPAVSLPVTRRTNDPFELFEVTGLPEGVERPGVLELVLAEVVVARWDIEWAPVPRDDPEIDAAQRALTEGARDRAEMLFERARRRGGFSKLEAEIQLGRIAFESGRERLAHERWTSAVQTAEALGSLTDVAGRLRSLAYLELQSTAFARAREHLARAREISESIGDETGSARGAYLDAMLLLRTAASPAMARKYLTKAFDTARALNDEDATLLYGTGLASVLGEFYSADSARALLRQLTPRDERERGALDHALARAYVELIAWERGGAGSAAARGLRKEMVALLDRVEHEGLPNDRAYLLAALVRLDIGAGDPESARAGLRALRAIDEEARGPIRLLEPLLSAEIELLLPGPPPADIEDRLRNFQEEVRRANGGDLDVSIVAEILIGDARRLRGDVAEARSSYQNAIVLGDALANRFAVPKSKALYRRRRASAVEQLTAIDVQRGEIGEAFDVVERARARELEELVLDARAAQSSPSWEQYLALRLSFEEKYPSGCPSGDAGVQCRAARAAVDVALDDFFATSPEVSGADAGRSFADRFRRLPGDRAVLSVARVPGGWVSFWIRAGRIEVAPFSGDDPLAPWRDRLEGLSVLYVSPGDHRGALDLPLRSLEGTNEAFGDRTSVVILVHGPHGPSTPPGRGALVVGAGDDLLEAAAEAREVAAGFPDALLLVGESATRNAVLSAWAGRRSLIHFSLHARNFERDDSWSTRLILFKSDIRIEDFLTTTAEGLADLVVLNGCGTAGLGGGTGLPAALIGAAGRVGAVLATVEEDVPDRDARAFALAFLAAHRRLGDPIAAYREAFAASHAGRSARTPFRLFVAAPA